MSEQPVDLTDLADELHDLYHSKLSHEELRAEILGISYRLREGLSG